MSHQHEAPKRDRYTLQYAELRRGNAAAKALAEVTLEFLRSYAASKHYDDLLSALVERLTEGEDAASGEEALRALSASLSARQHELLDEERRKEKRPKKWAPQKPVKDIINESSDDEGGNEAISAEEKERRAKEEEAAQKTKEEEWRRIQEHMDEMQRQKEENEAKLAARARQVDTKAFEEKLRQEGVVLVNAGSLQNKKGGKGGNNNNKDKPLSPEEIGQLHLDIAETMRAKESFKTVLSTSDEDLPAKIAEARKELAAAEAEAKALGSLENKRAGKTLNKGQITQLQQKLSKQTIEKNRVSLQVKAMEQNPQRDELVGIYATLDKLRAEIEMATEF